MIQIYGSLFALVQIVETCQWVADANGIDGSIAVDVGRRDQLRTTILGSAQEYCLKFELKSALDRINRIKLLFDYPHDCTHANMRQQLKTLHENIEDDLRNRIHWQIPVSKIVHIDDVEDIPFTEGPDLIQARREWYEAEWCFGLERYTACVAHAMRLAELGLRSLTRQLIGDAILGRAIEFVDWETNARCGRAGHKAEVRRFEKRSTYGRKRTQGALLLRSDESTPILQECSG